MTYLKILDGPYKMFTWILLAKPKVNPVVWLTNPQKKKEMCRCVYTVYLVYYLFTYLIFSGLYQIECNKSDSYRFHIQVGHVFLLNGVQASHVLSQNVATMKEVRQRDVDTFHYLYTRGEE